MGDKVVTLSATYRKPPSDGGSEPPMELIDRVNALEKDAAAIKLDVAVIRSNYATKEDLHKELHTMTWRIFGAAGLLTAAVYFIARYIH